VVMFENQGVASPYIPFDGFLYGISLLYLDVLGYPYFEFTAVTHGTLDVALLARLTQVCAGGCDKNGSKERNSWVAE
jgi:hypothetical protein